MALPMGDGPMSLFRAVSSRNPLKKAQPPGAWLQTTSPGLASGQRPGVSPGRLHKSLFFTSIEIFNIDSVFWNESLCWYLSSSFSQVQTLEDSITQGLTGRFLVKIVYSECTSTTVNLSRWQMYSLVTGQLSCWEKKQWSKHNKLMRIKRWTAHWEDTIIWHGGKKT